MSAHGRNVRLPFLPRNVVNPDRAEEPHIPYRAPPRSECGSKIPVTGSRGFVSNNRGWECRLTVGMLTSTSGRGTCHRIRLADLCTGHCVTPHRNPLYAQHHRRNISTSQFCNAHAHAHARINAQHGRPIKARILQDGGQIHLQMVSSCSLLKGRPLHQPPPEAPLR